MATVVIRGPWSRRQVLGWTAGVVCVLVALKLAVRQEAGAPVGAPGSAVPGTASATTLPTPHFGSIWTAWW